MGDFWQSSGKMTKEQFQVEKLYCISLSIAKSMLEWHNESKNRIYGRKVILFEI
jgi:hypothetical protein